MSQPKLIDNYESLSKQYQAAYHDYLKKTYEGSNDQAAARKILTELNSKLTQASTSASNDAMKTFETAQNVEKKTLQIYEKAKLLDLQKDLIEKKNDELHSKRRQIEMGIQKNRYRRNLIYFLLVLNVVLLVVFYYLYTKGV